MIRFAALLVAALAAVAPAQAQTQTPPPAAPSARIHPQTKAGDDADFARKAAADGFAEIWMAQLALRKSGRDDIRKFAQAMIDSHQRLNGQVKEIAMAKGITLPTGPQGEAVRQLDRLGVLDGSAFDKAYLAATVTAHEKAIRLFEDQVAKGQDDALKGLAGKNLDELQAHLQMARALAPEQKT
ncbi:MAG: DUF4142 domain-containing protein [Rhodospirillales bacterium]|nr:DUF4142 domain-containing protein [Rhodospirillales bacterium]